MRYPQRGGLTAERRPFREGVRLQAAEIFSAGDDSAVVAKQLRVSVRSVQRWRRAWQDGGDDVLRSKGSAARRKLTAGAIRSRRSEPWSGTRRLWPAG
ncbi:helix-turn-helix domain-containing protein [Streptomyces formicae]|uniref:Uncharacterized protein n=1 Tax=Streptomyces formicae TaxID=1616117 RepID=A0A291Q1X5_9ACTN|nr:hypothetical protein KY5_0574 [Streptomyces formicae]